MKLWELYSGRDALREEGKIVPGVNTTVDVQPGETQRQAAKMGFSLDSNGHPPLLVKGNSYSTGAKDTLLINDPSYGPDGTKLKESTLDEIRTIEPFNAGSDEDNERNINKETSEGLPEQVGEIKDWTIHCEDWPKGMADMPTFYFLDSWGNKAGAARLSAINLAKNHYKVGHIWINPRYQGQGYGFAFYSWLLDQGIILDADYDQTSGSQAMWKKIAKTYKVRITRGDFVSGPLQDISVVYGPEGFSLGLRASKA